MKTSVRAVG